MLGDGDFLVSRSDRFTARKRPPAPVQEAWMGPRVGLGKMAKKNIIHFRREWNHGFPVI
jgi:hypothetical protein